MIKQSKFYTEGKLTPSEFILAGDFLVSKCPTWKWCAAKENLYNSALPKDKQYLLTTVKSNSRATDFINNNSIKEIQLEDDWVEEDLNPEKIKEQGQKVIDLEENLSLSGSNSLNEVNEVQNEKEKNSENKKENNNEIDDF